MLIHSQDMPECGREKTFSGVKSEDMSLLSLFCFVFACFLGFVVVVWFFLFVLFFFNLL